jgi:divinyl chlorophyllide a 8-vinyl-reductase
VPRRPVARGTGCSRSAARGRRSRRAAGELLFALLGRPPRFRTCRCGSSTASRRRWARAGRVVPPLAAKAELARIGRYYATESMLVWDERARAVRRRRDAVVRARHARGHYRALLRGEASADLGAHAAF